MRLAIRAKFVKRLGLFVMFCALIRWAAICDFVIHWREVHKEVYKIEVDGRIRAAKIDAHAVIGKDGNGRMRDEKAALRPLCDKDRDDVESRNAVFATTAVVSAKCLSVVEDKIVFSRVLSRINVTRAAYVSLLLASIGYALYVLASAFDKSVFAEEVSGMTWCGLSVLILVSLFLLPLCTRRPHVSEKTIARCRQIVPPQELDSDVKTLVNIILGKEAER